MALLTYILLLHFLNYTLAQKCAIDNTPDYITWEKELLEDLESAYNSDRAPNESTVVKVTCIMETFYFDSKEEVMTMQIKMITKWNDERLKWDPEKHHGIKEIDVSNFFHLWTPFFRVSNSADFLDAYLSFYNYNLNSTGDILGKHFMLQEAWCRVKLTNWPYDMQECTYDIEAKESSEKTGNITVNYNIEVMEPNGVEWYIYDYKQVKDNSTKRLTKYNLLLMREAVGLSAIAICPAFLLTVLSILSLCLDVRRKVRLAIICFSLLGHYYFLTELSYNIPKESQFPPTLLLYYRGSVVLSVFIIILTFFLAAMCKLKSTPHNYVKLINDFVYENKYRRYFVFLRWDFHDVTVDIKPGSEDWMKFANVVNSAVLFCVIFAYIGLYGTNIPKRTYRDANNDY